MKRLLASVSIAAMMIAAAPAFAEVKQGGEMIVTFKDYLITLDPAIGYDWKNWSVIKSVFDGLMDYKPGTTELVPDLAESYEVSDDGLTYTFKLRNDVTFCSGKKMTAKDVVATYERWLDPETKGLVKWRMGDVDKVSAPDLRTWMAEHPHGHLTLQLEKAGGAPVQVNVSVAELHAAKSGKLQKTMSSEIAKAVAPMIDALAKQVPEGAAVVDASKRPTLDMLVRDAKGQSTWEVRVGGAPRGVRLFRQRPGPPAAYSPHSRPGASKNTASRLRLPGYGSSNLLCDGIPAVAVPHFLTRRGSLRSRGGRPAGRAERGAPW